VKAIIALKEISLKKLKIFYNGRFYTQAGNGLVANSMVVRGSYIEAVGFNLHQDKDYSTGDKIDLKSMAVLPGFVDAHTHIYFLAASLDNVELDGLSNFENVLKKIKKHASGLARKDWVIGKGFSPDQWKKYVMPDRYDLDKVTGVRPAAFFSKDQHLMWVNSEALRQAGITRHTTDPSVGKIERDINGELTGILKEMPTYFPIVKIISRPARAKITKLYKKALETAYRKGITGLHSMDGPDAWPFFRKMAEDGRLGLRICYYPPPIMIPELKRLKARFGYGNDYFRLGGIKIFADGSLGSQTAFCFNKYKGSQNNYGIETTNKDEILSIMEKAGRIGLPCAVHAIGDKAISNVLDCLEKRPALKGGQSDRIEHLQMIRRRDIKRLKKLNVVASMQPTHCPADIDLTSKYWGSRGRNCFIFRTLIDNNIDLVFGSDAPIEPLDPIAGISAAVNRTIPGNRTAFYPEERITVSQAVYRFTTSASVATGRGYDLGRLLPGYKADFIILSDDIFKTARTKISDIKITGTFFDGCLVYNSGELKY
jgi:predicted amidohydrolase YtcJ